MPIKMALYCVALGVYGLVVFGLVAQSARAGFTVLTFGLALAVSTIPMLLVRSVLEFRLDPKEPNLRAQIMDLFSLHKGSWAFILGDAISLPLALAAAAYAWHYIDTTRPAWYNTGWWLVLSVVVGSLIGIGFRLVDAANYRNAGVGGALVSPTKILHDPFVYALFASLLIYICVPVLVTAFNRVMDGDYGSPIVIAAVVAVLAFGSWAVFGVRDAIVGLDVRQLHPVGYDWDTLTPRYYE